MAGLADLYKVTPAVTRRCFISYHHAGDQAYVDTFVKALDDGLRLFTARGLGLRADFEDGIINSTNTDYVMSEIRRRYMNNSTVTIVMLGKCTWARRYCDWEIAASLRTTKNSNPNGLLGVKLPTYAGTLPPRFQDNLLTDEKKAAGFTDCYARWIDWNSSVQDIKQAIEDAYSRRTTHAHLIDNKREAYGYNRTCS